MSHAASVPECRDWTILDRGREVIAIEASALARLADSLGDSFAEACHAILHARKLVVTGMGKSGHVARKVAATFTSTGTPAIFLHPGEAAHGDMGILATDDVLLVLSNSGNTAELRPVMQFARQSQITIVGIASRETSKVHEMADISILLPQEREACAVNVAPTTSTTMQLALGDALAMTVMDVRGVSKNLIRAIHPSGAIGLALTPVGELLQSRRKLPLIEADAGMPEVISTISQGCAGLVGVVDCEKRLIGIITDGDIRRHFDMLQSAKASDIMTREPKVICASTPAAEAIQFLNEEKITAAFIVNEKRFDSRLPLGLIHIHDLLHFGLT